MNFIRGLIILLACQLAGEGLAQLSGLPVPGGVIGMLLLFVALIVRQGVPESLEHTASAVLKPLTLYFVPASVGIMTMGPLLAQEGLRIGLVMLLSTVLPMVACGYALDRWLARREPA